VSATDKPWNTVTVEIDGRIAWVTLPNRALPSGDGGSSEICVGDKRTRPLPCAGTEAVMTLMLDILAA
jgi:hypothetical protein